MKLRYKLILMIVIIIGFILLQHNNSYAKSLDDYIEEYGGKSLGATNYYEIECNKDEEAYKEELRKKSIDELEAIRNAFHPSTQVKAKTLINAVIIEKQNNIKYAQVLEDDNIEMWYPGSTGSTTRFAAKASIIATLIRVIGVVVSVVALAIIGIRIMFGSIEQKAQYKELLVPYVVGAVMVFGISWITSMIFEMVQKI